MIGRAGRSGEIAMVTLVILLARTKDFIRTYATADCRKLAVSEYLDGEANTVWYGFYSEN